MKTKTEIVLGASSFLMSIIVLSISFSVLVTGEGIPMHVRIAPIFGGIGLLMLSLLFFKGITRKALYIVAFFLIFCALIAFI